MTGDVIYPPRHHHWQRPRPVLRNSEHARFSATAVFHDVDLPERLRIDSLAELLTWLADRETELADLHVVDRHKGAREQCREEMDAARRALLEDGFDDGGDAA